MPPWSELDVCQLFVIIQSVFMILLSCFLPVVCEPAASCRFQEDERAASI